MNFTNESLERIALWVAHTAVLAGLVLPALAPAQESEPAPNKLKGEENSASSPDDAVTCLINRLVEKGVLEATDAKELSEITGEKDVVVGLINRLVKKGVLENKDATQLVATAQKQAKEEREATKTPELPAPVEGEVRVTYVPETVRSQIRDELRSEVMEQAKAERWANPRIVPDWVTGLDLDADLRLRWESILFPQGNVNTGAFPDFNKINTGDPFDTAGSIFSPQQNVDADRNRFRIRARFGIEDDLGDNWTMGMTFASGSDNSPVTTNQTLGASGGNFSKYQLWLDKAYLAYQFTGDTSRDVKFTAGRFDNPFFSTSILWDPDVHMDGFALSGKYQIQDWLKPFASLGAFPIYNSAFNFATNNPSKFSSYNKFLYAAQGGAEIKVKKDVSAKFGVGFYDFENAEGKKSAPFDPLVDLAGSTDESRPSFAQKGNSYFPLRDIVRTVDLNGDPLPQEQYFGLATPYQLLSFTGRLDFNQHDPIQVSLIGEYIRNLAWNRNEIEALGVVNNRGPDDALGNLGAYAGGDTAWMTEVVFGSPAFEQAGDWRFGIGYRHIESDAVMDAFNDSDFGFGGTNLKGFIVSGAIALQKKISVGVSWMSANSIAGPQYANDIFQVDLSQKF